MAKINTQQEKTVLKISKLSSRKIQKIKNNSRKNLVPYDMNKFDNN